jgi:hypothetical protein
VLAPHRPLPRLQPNSGLPEFGRFIDWPKSETSDFGSRDREGACDKIHVRTLTPSPTLPRKRGRERTEHVAHNSYSLISRLKRSISAPRCGLSLSQSMVRILPRSSWVLAIASVIAPSSFTFELVGITS